MIQSRALIEIAGGHKRTRYVYDLETITEKESV